MAKWRCDECVDNENTGDSCVLDMPDDKSASTCPYSGTDCEWYLIEDKDSEEAQTTKEP